MTNTSSHPSQINHRLLEKLRCPACGEGTFQETCGDALRCQSCGRSFPIIRGIPNLTYFPEDTDEGTAFNRMQAQYEREIHDRSAQDEYDEIVIQRYGDKTEVIATGWAKDFPEPFLDFGCGTGQVCQYLRKYNTEVYAFDISIASVERNVHDNGVLAVAANAFYVPFADRAFETVCCNGVLHHIIDLKSAIDVMARVSNRYLVVSEVCVSSYYPLWLRSEQRLRGMLKLLLNLLGLLDRIQRKRSVSHGGIVGSKYERPLDPKEIMPLLEQAGFRIKRLRFWSNPNLRRRSPLKKLLIRMLVSRKAGTHFEICAERRGN